MPWFRLAFRPEVVSDLKTAPPDLAQRLFDKTKWLASNVENLRHEPLSPDFLDMHKYAVGDWRIFYSIDRADQWVDIHLIHQTATPPRTTERTPC